MSRKKNKGFMEGLEENEEVEENTEKAEDEENEREEGIAENKRKINLSSVPNSLKRMRKIIEGVDPDNLSIADKFDLRMSASYIDFLKETIDNILEQIK